MELKLYLNNETQTGWNKKPRKQKNLLAFQPTGPIQKYRFFTWKKWRKTEEIQEIDKKRQLTAI
jgi:hypothetical protein